jgi:hypothetical protein
MAPHPSGFFFAVVLANNNPTMTKSVVAVNANPK